MAVVRRSIETKTVGKTLAHDSAPLHVQGSATYIDDIPEAAGTLHAAETLYKPQGKHIEFGVVEPGMLADLVIVDAPATGHSVPPRTRPAVQAGDLPINCWYCPLVTSVVPM